MSPTMTMNTRKPNSSGKNGKPPPAATTYVTLAPPAEIADAVAFDIPRL